MARLRATPPKPQFLDLEPPVIICSVLGVMPFTIIPLFVSLVLTNTINAHECFESDRGSVRLTGLNSSFVGYVQVCKNGHWAPVSIEKEGEWTKKNSIVTCRELGFLKSVRIFNQDPNPNITPLSSGFYYSVECNGLEQYLIDCSWTIKTLAPNSQRKEVMILCKEVPFYGEIILVGINGHDNEGIIEIYNPVEINGAWSSISSDEWDETDAGVACRQLGFKGGSNISYSSTAAHMNSNQPTGNHVYGGFQCSGSESHLTECEHSNVYPNKTTSMLYGGVICKTEAKGGDNLNYNILLLVAMIVITLLLISILLVVLKCTLTGFRRKPSSNQNRRNTSRVRNRQTHIIRTQLDSEIPYASLGVVLAPPSYEDTLQADHQIVQVATMPPSDSISDGGNLGDEEDTSDNLQTNDESSLV